MRNVYGGTFTKGAAQTITGGGSNVPYTDSNGKLRTHEITVTSMAHAWPSGPGGQNANYVDNTKINYPAFVMDFWFTNNLRAGAGTVTTTTVAGTTTTTAVGATTTAGATTTTAATTTTTTASQAYDQTITATVTSHYIAGRANVTQYNTLGARYGYNANIPMYHCATLGGWTDHSNCSAI